MQDEEDYGPPPDDHGSTAMQRSTGGGQMAQRQTTDIANPAGVEVKSLTAAMQSAAIEEIRAAFLFARQFPRNEDASRAKVIAACKSPTLIRKKQGMYSFKIGGALVEGLTIHVAKEIARSMGNMRFGSYIIHDTEESRTIRCWALDLETNVKDEFDDTFRKMVFRKNKPPMEGGYWKPVDDRELLMLTNLKASKGIRNCILNLTPFHIRDAAIETIYEMIEKRITADPKQFLRDLLDDFAAHGVTVEELLDYASVPNPDQLTPAQLKYLRGVANALAEGHTWRSFVEQLAKKKGIDEPVATASDLASKLAVKAAAAASKGTDTPTPPSGSTPPPVSDTKRDAAAPAGAKTDDNAGFMDPSARPAETPPAAKKRPAKSGSDKPEEMVP